MTRPNYPETVLEVIDPNVRFNPDALRAVRDYAKSKPWRGEMDSREEKFSRLNRGLAEAYDMPMPGLIFGVLDGSGSGSSYYHPTRHEIVLNGRLSVVTYLHEFAHARGMGERSACRWSINMFRKCFPKSFSRLLQRGHMLIRPNDIPKRRAS